MKRYQRVRYCTANTLTGLEKSIIRDRLMWADGGMSAALKYRLPQHYLALLYHRNKLIGWGLLAHFRGRWEVGAFIDKRYRRRGYATMLVDLILKRYNTPKRVKLIHYDLTMGRVLQSLGYNAALAEWDGENRRLL